MKVFAVDPIHAYLSGFFDGEGCVRVCRINSRTGKKYYALQCILVNTDKRPLELAHSLYGGSFQERKKTKSWRRCWTLVFQSSDSERFLRDILPYSIVKKEEIEIALEYVERFANHGHRGPRGFTEQDFIDREMYKQKLERVRANRFLKEDLTGPQRTKEVVLHESTAA